MDKIGIVASTVIEYVDYIRFTLNDKVTSGDRLNKFYHRIDPEIPFSIKGIKFKKVLFANRKYENLYGFFKELDLRTL